MGGMDDGYSVLMKHTTLHSLENIYKGGTDDGYSLQINSFTQNKLYNIYNGGVNDGYAALMNAVTQNSLYNIYLGGADDGFNTTLHPIIQNSLTNIYHGGNDDGYALAINHGLQNLFFNIYSGGLNDGYDAVIKPVIQNQLYPLPLKLTIFNGNWIGEKIQLHWQTLIEENTSHFELERSVDNPNHFTAIADIPATNQPVGDDYYFIDTNTHKASLFYYRLKNVDKDQSFSYSFIIHLIKKEKQASYNIYPNPGTGLFYLLVKGEIALQLYSYKISDMNGKLLLQSIMANNPVLIDLTKLAAGIYNLQIFKSNQLQSTIKILIQR